LRFQADLDDFVGVFLSVLVGSKIIKKKTKTKNDNNKLMILKKYF